MTEHYYKPVGAGDGMGTVVVDEEGMRAELTAARARIAELEASLRDFLWFGCPLCNGDCGGAQPPPMTCIMSQARAALAKRAK